MNIIFAKLWKFLKQKNRWLIGLVILIIMGQYGLLRLKDAKIADLKDKYTTEVKLKDALLDSVRYYKNKRDELVAEKLTIQETIKNLEKMYGQLTESQKELIQRIKEMDKKNSIIAAALIKSEIKIDSLMHVTRPDGPVTNVDTAKHEVEFIDSTSVDFRYNIQIGKVNPQFPKINPTLLFKLIEMPNEQFLEFHWKNDKKKGYPIAASISNSNKYIKVVGFDTYAIPPLDKMKLNPNGWQKIGNFFIKNGRTMLYIGVGAGAGAGAYWLITK